LFIAEGILNVERASGKKRRGKGGRTGERERTIGDGRAGERKGIGVVVREGKREGSEQRRRGITGDRMA